MKNKNLEQFKSNQLRACQLKQLGILEEIDRICKKHNIDYWLDGGTLLGAVRHGGFIPWDDDIDIAMAESDLERFVKVAQDELNENLFLQTPKTEPESKEPIVKIRDLNSLFIEGGDRFNADYQKGIYVDIFPFIDYPTTSKKWVKVINKGISKSYSILHAQHYYSLRSIAEFFFFGTKYYIYTALWHIADAIMPHGKYMSNILINNGYGIVHRKDSIFPLSTIEFEGKTFPAPHDPDAYLKDLYKDYMQIPPKEKQQIHSVFIMPELISK